jgi:hypothetical protein
MERRLDILRELYGEGDDGPALRESLRHDDELRQEAQALSQVKFRLDHRRRQRPDAAVVDRVVAAARDASPLHATRRRDRGAVPHRRWRMAAFGSVGALTTVLLAVSISFWQWPSSEPTSTPSVATDSVPGSFQRDLPTPLLAEEPAAAEPAPRATSRPAPPATTMRGRPMTAQVAVVADSADEGDWPAWDDADDMLRLHRRIELLQAGSAGTVWDESPIPQDLLYPPSGRSRMQQGLQQAVQRPGER